MESRPPNPENIFKGTAKYYRRYRRPYQNQVFDDIVNYYKLDGRGILLDLGCGTGELALPLAPYFTETIGLDVSPDMLEEARSQAIRTKIHNVRWLLSRSEEVATRIHHPIQLTTAGVSFHWMNQAVVLEQIYTLTAKNGGMVIIDDHSPVLGKEKTEDWKVKRKEIIKKYLGFERRAGDFFYKDYIPDKIPFDVTIAQSKFKSFDHRAYPYTTERTIEEITGFLYSTSYANKRLLGSKAKMFEEELRHELLQLVPSGAFIEQGVIEAYFLKK